MCPWPEKGVNFCYLPIPFLNVRGISNPFERPLRRLRGNAG